MFVGEDEKGFKVAAGKETKEKIYFNRYPYLLQPNG